MEVRRPIKWFGDGSTVEVLSRPRAVGEAGASLGEGVHQTRLDPGQGSSSDVPGFESFGPVDVEALAALPFKPDTSKTT